MDPITQGQQAAADGAADASQQDQGSQTPATPAVPPGVQARFDELTAKFREQERQNQQLTQQLMQNQQLMLATQQRMQQPVNQPPPLNIDPDQKALLDAYAASQISPQLAQMQAQFNAFQQQMATQMGVMRVDSAVPAGLDPKVSERARAIVNHYAQQGSHVDPAMAVDLAIGQLTREGVSLSAASEQARRNANAGVVQNIQGGGTRGAPNVNGGGFQVVAPEVLDSWPAAKQMQYHEQIVRQFQNAPLIPTTDDFSGWNS